MARPVRLSYTTARWLAPTAFLVDMGAQIYGLTTHPSMVDVHYANFSFFSPHLMFVAVGFLPLQVLQVAWLWWVVRADAGMLHREPEASAEATDVQDFAPFFVLFHLCLIAWVFAWNSSRMILSVTIIAVNAYAQVYYMITKLHLNYSRTAPKLTKTLSSIFGALGIIDILHTGSAAFFRDQPVSLLVKVLTGPTFWLGALWSNTVFGGCLVFGLLAFAAGQEDDWRVLLGLYALITGVIVGWRAGQRYRDRAAPYLHRRK